MLTTYVDTTDGQRYFADGDRWTAVPRNLKLIPADDEGAGGSGVGDSRASNKIEPDYIQFSITEPSTGTVHQAVQANEVVVTKKFLNSRCGKWQPIPAAWEASQPDVVKMLKEIDSTLPEWGSVAEQILALRMCDYNIQVSPKSCKLNVQAN